VSDGSVNILHISDLHFGLELVPDKNITSTSLEKRNDALDKLINEIEKIGSTWKPNIIVVTGDIGWKCKETDYEEAGKWFSKLIDAMGLGVEDIVLCPGNHDIDRKAGTSLMNLVTIDDANEHLTKDDPKNFLLRCEPFHNYVEFCRKFGIEPLENGFNDKNHLSAHLYGYRNIKDITFVVLNSAWNCRDRKAPETDDKKLWLGKNLVDDITYRIKKTSTIKIALFHHPEGSLHRNEQFTYTGPKSALKTISELSDIILNGHEHCTIETRTTGDYCHMFYGGAAYTKESCYRNSFQIMHINKKKRTFSTKTFTFDVSDEKWSVKNGHKNVQLKRLNGFRSRNRKGGSRNKVDQPPTIPNIVQDYSLNIQWNLNSLNFQCSLDALTQDFRESGTSEDVKIVEKLTKAVSDLDELRKEMPVDVTPDSPEIAKVGISMRQKGLLDSLENLSDELKDKESELYKKGTKTQKIWDLLRTTMTCYNTIAPWLSLVQFSKSFMDSLEKTDKGKNEQPYKKSKAGNVFKNRADYPMQSLIQHAKNSIFVIGINLEAVVNVRGILKEKVEQGLDVRLLLLNPHHESMEYFSKFSNVDVDVRKNKIISNLSILNKEFREMPLHKNNFEIRQFDNFLTAGMIGIDMDEKYGQLIIQNYMYHSTPDKTPMFSLFANKDGELYKLYKDNMELLWVGAGKQQNQ